MSRDREDLVTHPSLLLRVRNPRDSQAWEEFVGVYGPLIFGYCRLRRLQDSDASDVAQEVLARLAKSLWQFEYQPDRGRFRDWLGKIVHRELLRHGGRRRPEVIYTGDDLSDKTVADDSSWSDHFHARLLQAALQRIQGEFAQETWEAFTLAWIENMPAANVASKLGIGIQKVYVSQSRVLKRLRAEVTNLSDDLPNL
jgi:RNA polymerase sigma-70 factor (ECF subfamily)